MLRFAVALAAYATRLIVPVVIALTSFGVTLLLVVLPLDRATYPNLVCKGWACMDETHRIRYDWQIPAAILVGIVGLALAALVALWNRRRPQPRPVPPPRGDVQSAHSGSMLRFRISVVAYSVRLLLPIVMAMVVVGGAVYLATTPLHHEEYSDPNRFGWQTPAAVLIGVIGVGVAFGIAVWNRWSPRPRPLPPLPAGWQTGA